ncbi:Ger(x)C family spore germination protein [Crassaminicella thermophila]|uniref:Ger(X)C family spore germination protein n=1 Tax=Crassaminicella thermophila TaxID=2599308 RepID=A0A5C0SAZ9_CRATE|nr:Ger(x)C family spore germination protein [Crassaminicella thermophila]QEK11220.1 Ger(x)C family spore germination protein [Crassaminicella thermophila]
MKKKIFLFMICINIFFLSGCWNYKDIDEIRLVAGMAIDYDEKKNEYITTIEIINPASKKESQMSGELYVSRGKLPFDGVRDIIMKTGRKLYWAHAKVIIVSQNIAKKNIISLLDYVYRDAEFREDMRIIVSKEKTAREILELHKEEKIHPVIGIYLDDVIESEKSISKYHCAQIWKFIKDLYDEGISPTLPVIRNISDGEKVQPYVGGLAVFKGDKMVGWLDEFEAQAFLWVIDHVYGGLVIVESKMKDKPTKITLEILNNKTKVKPIYKEGELVMKIDIETDVMIGEIGGTDDFIGKEGRNILKKDAQKQIKTHIEKVIKKVQKEYDSDIFRFSKSIKKEMPNLWKKIKPNWDEFFRGLKTEVNVVVNIKGSALQLKPLKVAK